MSSTVFAPYDPSFVADPYPSYAQLRTSRPILKSPDLGMTLFFKYRDIVRLLTDERLGRTMEHTMSAEEIAAARRFQNFRALPNFSRYVAVNLLESEGNNHVRIRRVLSGALNPRIKKLAATVKAITAELTTNLPQGAEIDFIADLAEPLPVWVIADLLGWPRADRQRLRPWSAAITRLYEKNCSAEDQARAEAAASEFAAMLNDQADRRLREPCDDLISALVATESREQGLTRDETIASCMLLLNAGHEATVNGAGNGLLALLRHGSQLDKLRRDPTVVPNAVEEMLRYDPPLQLFHRYVLEDMEIEGVALQRGEKVGLMYGSANRDPDAFANPETFDIQRSPNRHLAFGAATHFCLGAPLARLELITLFNALLQRCTDFQLMDETPEYHCGLVFRGVKQLRVRL